MSILNKILGRKQPNSTNLSTELDDRRTKRADASQRIANAVAAFDDARTNLDKPAMAAAKVAEEDARLDLEIAESAIATLEKAHAEQIVIEESRALEGRTQAALRLVRERAPELLKRYDDLAAEIAQIVEEFEAINEQVEEVNHERRKAGLTPITDADAMHRREPDRHIPERREERSKFVTLNRFTGLEEDVMVTGVVDGKVVPMLGGGIDMSARKITEEVVVQEASVQRGAGLPSLRQNVVLPAGRLGRSGHWPKQGK